jgi:hypothetical protein
VTSAVANGELVIETDGLTKRYDEVVAVDQLSLRVPKGGVFGFLGPNGSGKTGGGFGAPAAPADLAHAGFVLVGYTPVLGALAFWTFHRRDVQGATGGG